MHELDDFTPEDQAEVRALILAGLAHHWGEVDPTLNPDLDDLAAVHARGRVIVGRGRDGVCATGTIIRRSAETAEIVRMSVRRDLRGTGLGRAIVEELLTTARQWEMDRVILETASTWSDVIAFYRRCGFQITHETDGDFGRDTWFEYRLKG